jgi:hypothetical protein
MLPNNLFSHNQSINYVFSSIIHDCLPKFGQVFDPMFEEIHQFGHEEVIEPILELSVVVEGNSAQTVGETGRDGNPMGKGPESRADVEESPSRVPEWPLSSCSRCVVGIAMLKNHSMSFTQAFLLDCFLQAAKLLTIAVSSDGQVPLRQFIMNNPFHIPPDAQNGSPKRRVSLMSKLPCLKCGNHFLAVLSAIESSP